MSLNIVGIVLVVLAIVFSFLLSYSTYLGWYSISGGGFSASIGLFNQCNPSGGCYSASGAFSNMWYATSYLMVAALILAVVGVAYGATMMAGKAKPSMAVGVTIPLAFILSIVGPIWMAVGQPSALGNACSGYSPSYCTSFWGSTTISGTTVTWGPAAGWYLAVVAGVLFLVASIWGMMIYRGSMRSA